MKLKLVFLAFMMSCLGLQAQKLQVGVSYAPEFDYRQGQRLANGFNYNFRMGAFVEGNLIDRVGVRGSIFPNIYGGTTTFLQQIVRFNQLDLDFSGEVHYYLVEISGVTVKGIAGLLVPARRFGNNFLTPEIMFGPGISIKSKRSFNTIIELFYRRALNAFEPFSIATVEFRIGLSWVLLGKN